MAAGRFSTIKYNEWICVTSQYEKAVSRIGRQVYQGWIRGKISDHGSITICEDISQAFKDAKELRRELEEEIERDALDGLSYEESKAVDEIRELTGTQKFVREIKMKVARVTTKASVHRNLQAYRDKVSTLSRELGMRAVNQYQSNPVLEMKSHYELCRLAEKLDEDQNKKWNEITAANKEEGGSLSFHTMLVGFFVSFASFGKGTKLGKVTLKLLKYDSEEEKRKLRKDFQNSNVSQSLEEQLRQDDEVEFDAARELAKMEHEYSQDPEERTVSYPPPAPPAANAPKISQPQQSSGSPRPGSSERDRDARAHSEASPPPPPPPSRGPEVLRKKSEPESGTWGQESWGSEPSPAAPPPPAASAPRIGAPPSAAKPPEPPKKTRASKTQEWGWGPGEKQSSWDPSAPSTQPPGASLRPDPARGVPRPPTPPAQPPRPPQGSDPIQRRKAPPEPVEPAPPPARPPAPPAPPPAPPPTPKRPVAPTPDTSDDDLLDGDALLPAFLRNRKEEVTSEPYVPDLPDFLKDDGDSPKLDILPFGKSVEKAPEEPFIPKMPDED